jgi:hypothetical protein
VIIGQLLARNRALRAPLLVGGLVVVVLAVLLYVRGCPDVWRA